MASLKDASELASELEARVRRLDEEVAGDGDLLNLVTLADDVAELADSLATTFAAIDEELGRRLSAASGSTRQRGAKRQARRRSGQSSRQSSARRTKPSQESDESTRAELLDQAKEAAIPGRSSMSKEELAK